MPGKFEAADGGTVFIDEIGELPLAGAGQAAARAAGPRVRAGGRHADAQGGRAHRRRHATATWRRWWREGKFREDLYYRIKVVELVLPPLRERGAEDIERLARHFIAAVGEAAPAAVAELTAAALERLKRYRWPGNVRELENCIESAVVLCEGEILAEHLPLPKVVGVPPAPVEAREAAGRRVGAEAAAAGRGGEAPHPASAGPVKGNRTAAAKVLQIGRNTLGRKLKEYGLGDEG